MTTLLPVAQTTQEDLFRWYKLKADLAQIKDAEMELRKRIFADKFPDPKEGTNRLSLPPIEGREDKYDLMVVHSIDRTLDMALFNLNLDRMREAGIAPDVMVKYKPELVIGEYRKLTDAQKFIFDQVLIIKNGAPQMDIVTNSTRGRSRR